MPTSASSFSVSRWLGVLLLLAGHGAWAADPLQLRLRRRRRRHAESRRKNRKMPVPIKPRA